MKKGMYNNQDNLLEISVNKESSSNRFYKENAVHRIPEDKENTQVT